jgi:hypothetical protein
MLFEQAYHLGWFAPKYVWLTYSFLNWRGVNIDDTRCTPEMLRKMLNGILAITLKGTFVSDDSHTETFSGLVSKHGKPMM